MKRQMKKRKETRTTKTLLMDVEDEEMIKKNEEMMLEPFTADEARGFELPKKPITLTKADIRLYTHPNFNWMIKVVERPQKQFQY